VWRGGLEGVLCYEGRAAAGPPRCCSVGAASRARCAALCRTAAQRISTGCLWQSFGDALHLIRLLGYSRWKPICICSPHCAHGRGVCTVGQHFDPELIWESWCECVQQARHERNGLYERELDFTPITGSNVRSCGVLGSRQLRGVPPVPTQKMFITFRCVEQSFSLNCTVFSVPPTQNRTRSLPCPRSGPQQHKNAVNRPDEESSG